MVSRMGNRPLDAGIDCPEHSTPNALFFHWMITASSLLSPTPQVTFRHSTKERPLKAILKVPQKKFVLEPYSEVCASTRAQESRWVPARHLIVPLSNRCPSPVSYSSLTSHFLPEREIRTEPGIPRFCAVSFPHPTPCYHYPPQPPGIILRRKFQGYPRIF